MLRNRSLNLSKSLIVNRLTGSHTAQAETLGAELATLLPAGTEITKIRQQWTRPHTPHYEVGCAICRVRCNTF